MFSWPIHPPRPPHYLYFVALKYRHLTSSFAPVIITKAARGLCLLNINICLFWAFKPHFHSMVQHGSTGLACKHCFLVFHWQKLRIVPGTWYFFWYHLGRGSKRAESMLKGRVKTLQIYQRESLLHSSLARHGISCTNPPFLNSQAIIATAVFFYSLNPDLVYFLKKWQPIKPRHG